MKPELFNNLKIVSAERNMLWSLCPFHKDGSRANLSISLHGKYLGRYKCWACGKEGWLTPSQKQHLDLESKKKYKQYAPIDWTSLLRKYILSYCKNNINPPFNVNDFVLEQLNCGWDNVYTFPFRNEKNEVIGIQLRYPDGKKRCIEGSKLGLFIPQGVDWIKQNIILICEGVSDTAVALDMGFNAVGLPSATAGHEIIISWLLKNTSHDCRYLIISDRDDAGINSSKKLIKEWNKLYGDMYYTVTERADLREWVQIDGKEYVRKGLSRYEV